MNSAESSKTTAPAADQRAVAIAQWVHHAARAEQTYLFGSRARGDFHRHSDVDVLVITDGQHPEGWQERLEDAARRLQAERNEEVVSVQVTCMTAESFRKGRNLVNNLAWTIAREGIDVMSSERLDHGGRYPEENDHGLDFEDEEDGIDWEDVADRLKDGSDYADDLETFADTGALARLKDKTLGNTAQQALENSYKALLGSQGVEYFKDGRHGDSLRILVEKIRNETDWPPGQPVPGENHRYLAAFAGSQRYVHEHLPLDKERVVRDVTDAVRELVQRVQEELRRHNA